MWVFVTGPSGNQVKITIMYFQVQEASSCLVF